MIRKAMLVGLASLSLIGSGIAGGVECYETNSERTKVFDKTEFGFSIPNGGADVKIKIDKSKLFQEIDGYGAAITGSTAYNLTKIEPEVRKQLLEEIFSENGMHYSMARVSIGCSDFSLDEYTWCDKEGIENFAIHEYDKRDLIPMLKEILKINPSLKIMAAPWTCPKWMKVDNLKDLNPYDSWTAGNLNPKYYDDYAKYFVRWIQTMEENGIPIAYLSLQNESLNPGLSASLQMPSVQQKEFLKHVGRAFEKAGVKTKIIIYDHDYYKDPKKYNHPLHYPLQVFEDKEAAKYTVGAGFHGYRGEPSEMSYIHSQYPDKKMFFTEMTIRAFGNTWSSLPDGVYNFGEEILWSSDWVFLDTANNWASCAITWNLLLDDKYGPWRIKGCHRGLGNVDVFAIDYKKPYGHFRRNGFFYTVGHMSKVVKAGAHRVESAADVAKNGRFNFTAFENPDGSLALVFVNKKASPIVVEVDDGTRSFTREISPHTVASFKWKE